MKLIFSMMLVACDVGSGQAECDVRSYSEAPEAPSQDGECWNAPMAGYPGWTWEACDNAPACACYGDDCWCPSQDSTTFVICSEAYGGRQ